METHRHYDSVNWDITKFTFGEIFIAIGACWTVFTLGKGVDIQAKWIAMTVICFASLLFGIMSLYTLIKNRTYFVLTSRHINELRHHAIKSNPMGFENVSNFWHNCHYPKVRDYFSTQFVSIYLIGFLSVVLSVASSMCLMILLGCGCFWLWVAIPLILSCIGIYLLIITVGKDTHNHK